MPTRAGGPSARKVLDLGQASPRLERRLVTANVKAKSREAIMFWFYWDTAWSVIISGIMFATIVAHPDADVRETWRS
jgi:hypothetical protein